MPGPDAIPGSEVMFRELVARYAGDPAGFALTDADRCLLRALLPPAPADDESPDTVLVMPRATSEAIGLPHRASYTEGARAFAALVGFDGEATGAGAGPASPPEA
jgi:hypothetical protein